MQRLLLTLRWSLPALLIGGTASMAPRAALAEEKPEFPPHAQVLEGYEKTVSSAPGGKPEKSLYTLWVRKKDGQMYAELPGDYASKKYFIALTVASGDRYAGLQSGEMYVYWRRYDKKLALIEPNVSYRSTGDKESKASVERLFTDRVVLEVPIVTMGPGGGPVIDMDQLFVGHAVAFFGQGLFNSYSYGRPSGQRPSVFSIKTAKAFPDNVEIGFEVPTAGGQLQTLHYSISALPEPGSNGYKPREADERVGYFTTAYSDLGKYTDKETRTRHINRWHLEKADPSLKLSPAKKPIVFYIEHTTPIRYRRWVREGILYWNKAFEKIGIADAIEVRYQDAGTGAYMDLDPEDVRYNFVRWLNNDVGTAIGPSRVHPMTGQILDADIILTDGWIRHFHQQFAEVLPQLAMEGFSAETLAWLAKHPDWDPRVLLAPAAQREHVKREIARKALTPFSGHEMANVDSHLIGDDRYDGLIGRTSQVNGLCMAAQGKAMDLAFLRMMLTFREMAEAAKDEKDEKESKKDEKDEEKEEENLLDGMPEKFIGPLLAELVAHEVGHTLGLRHNFKATAIYTLDEINGDGMKGSKPFAGSVMDYIPINMPANPEDDHNGDFTMIGIGPYDYWAIEYGYTFEKDLKPILARVKEPELQYATDEDTGGPDPLARRYDFSKNPLDYAKEQIRLAEYHRERLIDKFVKDGESWANARRGYELTLMMQMRSVSMMANWLGGAFVNRARKGDLKDGAPVEVVPPDQQREALAFALESTFRDEAYHLTPELVNRMTVDKWLDGGGYYHALSEEPTWPVHDRIMGMQSSVLTMLMQPTTLRRVYDNEFRVSSDKDMITLPELLSALTKEIWRELDATPEKEHTARNPLVSSLRRNLQDEHVDRLVDLCMPGAGSTAAYKPIADLACLQLREIHDRIEKKLKEDGDKLDPYTVAHWKQSQELIDKAMDAQYIYNANDIGGSSLPFFFFGQESGDREQGSSYGGFAPRD